MAFIETEKWAPNPEKPGQRIYVGQRSAREVFDDLEAHLRSIGYLPDEYFLFDCHQKWSGDRVFPKDGWLTNRVDYGGSEGIYLDVALEYDENGAHKCEHFATGKTLGESGADLDRMYLTASAITRAFHEDGVHARYAMASGSAPAQENITISLSAKERDVIVDGLMQVRISHGPGHPDYDLTCQLIKRIGDWPEQAEEELFGQDDYSQDEDECVGLGMDNIS